MVISLAVFSCAITKSYSGNREYWVNSSRYRKVYFTHSLIEASVWTYGKREADEHKSISFEIDSGIWTAAIRANYRRSLPRSFL